MTNQCAALNEAFNIFGKDVTPKQAMNAISKNGYKTCVAVPENSTCPINSCSLKLEDSISIIGTESNFFCCE